MTVDRQFAGPNNRCVRKCWRSPFNRPPGANDSYPKIPEKLPALAQRLNVALGRVQQNELQKQESPRFYAIPGRHAKFPQRIPKEPSSGEHQIRGQALVQYRRDSKRFGIQITVSAIRKRRHPDTCAQGVVGSNLLAGALDKSLA